MGVWVEEELEEEEEGRRERGEGRRLYGLPPKQGR
jgi:hypothetical protein